jgi:hypothetical protein
MPHLILDGKIVDTDRLHAKTTSKKGKEIDRWYSGKTHDFGGNIQALMSPGVSPYGSPTFSRATSTTSKPHASRSCTSSAPTPRTCRSWPTPATKVQVTASSPHGEFKVACRRVTWAKAC